MSKQNKILFEFYLLLYRRLQTLLTMVYSPTSLNLLLKLNFNFETCRD
jgi:hypothetical protein